MIYIVYKIIIILGWNFIVFMVSFVKYVKNDGKFRKIFMFKMMVSLEKYVKNEKKLNI